MKQFLAIIGMLFIFNLIVFSQQKNTCDETTSYLIDKEMPSVYLTFERRDGASRTSGA